MKGIAGPSLKLTVFTVFTVIVTAWLAAIIGNARPFATPYAVRAYFADVTGLLNGDVVKAAGVTIGRVDSVELSGGVALVTMALDEDVEVPANATAEIRFRNLVGQRMIVLAEGEGGAATTLAPGDTIPLERTEGAFDLSALFNGLRPLIRSTDPHDINLVSRALVKALEGRGRAVESFLGNLGEITSVVASRDEQLSSLLDDVSTVSSDLADRDAVLRAALRDMNAFLADVAASKEDLAGALETLDDAAGRFGGIVRRQDKNIRVELRDLATIFDAVNDRRRDLRGAIRALPEFLHDTQRVMSYGQWSNGHVINLCKDDLGTCGSRWMP